MKLTTASWSGRISIVLFLNLLIMCCTRAMVFTALKQKAIPPAAVHHTSAVNRRCDCRNSCYVDKHCTGFSMQLNASTNRFVCSISYTYLFDTDLAIVWMGTVWTFLKAFVCAPSYVSVAGTGCVIAVDAPQNFTAGVETCRVLGSVLVSPPTDAAFYHFARFINNTIFSKLNKKDRFYVGISNTNGTWRWDDGHTLTSTQGASLWYQGDPNEIGVQCAAMLFNPTLNTYGELVDLNCTLEGRIVCATRETQNIVHDWY